MKIRFDVTVIIIMIVLMIGYSIFLQIYHTTICQCKIQGLKYENDKIVNGKKYILCSNVGKGKNLYSLVFIWNIEPRERKPKEFGLFLCENKMGKMKEVYNPQLFNSMLYTIDLKYMMNIT